MRSVTELYGCYPGSDIYIVGTGTSLRVFPLDFLEGKITIGLNMAWKLVPIKYGITIVPEWNIPEFMENEMPHPEITWITRAAKVQALNAVPEIMEYADQHYYTFDSKGKKNSALTPDQPSDVGRVLDWVRTPTPNKLYLWSSISQSAVNLAANMGAKNIILLGCDNASIGGNDHANPQHTCWQGTEAEQRYMQYYEGLSEIRTVLRERKINLISLSPFLKLDNPKMDFEHLCQELEKPLLAKATLDRQRERNLSKLNRQYWQFTHYLFSENIKAFKKKLKKNQ